MRCTTGGHDDRGAGSRRECKEFKPLRTKRTRNPVKLDPNHSYAEPVGNFLGLQFQGLGNLVSVVKGRGDFCDLGFNS